MSAIRLYFITKYGKYKLASVQIHKFPNIETLLFFKIKSFILGTSDHKSTLELLTNTVKKLSKCKNYIIDTLLV